MCHDTHAQIESVKTATDYVTELKSNADETRKTTQCSGLASKGTKKFSDFVKGVGLKDNKNWPRGKVGQNTNPPKEGDPNSNAKAVATDLVALDREEKTIVAGLLAKTIEGGEVLEIRAVSSTSVMVNACYDLLSEGLGVVPLLENIEWGD
ncbi:Surface antigen [Anaplasma phagocytophilum]|uniref:Surface antigen n=1 Tax=Anaplasma phagocytophilum TaxID=948 RepID=A0AA45UTN7_ANAPH|nr:Surface antigen [Anaplasma phagocytophilum]